MIGSWALLPGAGLGLGIALLVRELWPAPPDLGQALQRLTPTGRTGEAPAAPKRRSLDERIVGTVSGLSSVQIPRRELALVGMDPTDYIRSKITIGFLGFFMPMIAVAGAAVLGIPVPFAVPLLFSVLLAGLLWLAPNQELKQNAAKARIEFQHAAAAYLELVALQRAGDAGPAEALERAGAVANGWAFLRIQDALDRARERGAAPWEGLGELADELDLPELADVAEIVGMAGRDGASVYGALRSRAEALRDTLLAAEKDQANANSERLVVPGVVLVVLMILFLIYPAVSRIFSNSA